MTRLRKQTKGFTLVEVIVAMVILAIGLLGTASLVMTSMQSNQGAYLRSQASMLATDMAERIRANSDATNAYVLSGQPAAENCSPCTPSQQANADLYQWWTNLTASIPGASARITIPSTGNYLITINWTESDAQLKTTSAKSYVLRVEL